MGSCTTILQRQTTPRGFHHQRLCCLAARTSFSTTYPEAGAREREPARQLHPELALQRHGLRNAAEPEPKPPALADSPGDALGEVSDAAGPRVNGHAVSVDLLANQPPPVTLLPPPFDGVASQSTGCIGANGHYFEHTALHHGSGEPGAGQQEELHHQQHHHPHQEQRSQQYFHQLARGNPHAAASREEAAPAHSALVVLPQHAHAQHAPGIQANGPRLLLDASGSPSGSPQMGPLHHGGTPPGASEAQLAAPAHAHHQSWQELGDLHHSRPSRFPGNGSAPASAVVAGPDLPPFLNAASRSGGEASTSGRCAAAGTSAGPGPGSAHAARRRPAARQARNERGQKASPAEAERASTTEAAGAAVASGPSALVHLGINHRDLGPSGSSSALDSVDSRSFDGTERRPEAAGNGGGGASSSQEAGREGNVGGAFFLDGAPDGAASEVQTLWQWRLGDDTSPLPEGRASSSLAATSTPTAGDDVAQEQAGASKRESRSGGAGGKGRGPVRRPRAHTLEEHRVLRARADMQRAALLPREPTVADLVLTADVMRATTWRELLGLLASHLERHEQAGLRDEAEKGRSGAERAAGRQQVAAAAEAPASSSQVRGQHGNGGAPAADRQEPEQQQHQQQLASAPPPQAGTRLPGQRQPREQLQPHAAPAPAAPAPPHPHPPVGPGGVLCVSMLPFTPQHLAAILCRASQLLALVGPPRAAAEARQLRRMVDALARTAAGLLQSPGMGLREIATIFYALVRLRHPVSKAYYVALMAAAQNRLSAARKAAERAASLAAAAAPCKPKVRRKDRDRRKRLAARAARSKAAAGANADPSPGPSSTRTSTTGSNDCASPSAGPRPYTALDLAMLLWGVAERGMGGLRHDFAAEYHSALLAVAHELSGQGVANVLFAMAQLRSPPPQALLAALCGRLVELMGCGGHGELTAAAAAATAGAVGPAGAGTAVVPPPAAPAAGSHSQAQGLQEGDAAELALATASAADADAWDAVAADAGAGGDTGLWDPAAAAVGLDDEGAAAAPGCRPTDVSMSLWALATLRLPPGGYCSSLLPAVERYSALRMSEFHPHDLSTLAWAVARLQHAPGPDWLAALCGAVSGLLGDLQPRALSVLLYSLAQMGARPGDEWLGPVLGRAAERMADFNPQALSLTIHALASMGYRPQVAWMAAFHAQLEAHPGQLDTRVRDKVREAYRTLGFRPGPAAPPAAAAATAARRAGPPPPPPRSAAPPPEELVPAELAHEGDWESGQQRHGEELGEAAAPERQRARVQGGAAAGDEAILVKPSRFSF